MRRTRHDRDSNGDSFPLLIAVEQRVREYLTAMGLPRSLAAAMAAADTIKPTWKQSAQTGIEALVLIKSARLKLAAGEGSIAIEHALRGGALAEAMHAGIVTQLDKSSGGKKSASAKKAKKAKLLGLIQSRGASILSADIPKTLKAQRLKRHIDGLSDLSESTIRRMI